MNENVQVLDTMIPEEAEVKLPSPELVHYYKDYSNRKIYIDYDIDDTLFEVTKQIIEYNRQDSEIPVDKRKPITIYLMTFGGDLYQTWALISTILASKTPITTVNMGVAMSCGFLILLAGHKRYALRHSIAMCHQGSGNNGGTYEQMEESQKNYKKVIDEMRDYIIERTGIDIKLFNKNKSKDWYFSDTEQVNYSIVNKIVENLDEIM